MLTPRSTGLYLLFALLVFALYVYLQTSESSSSSSFSFSTKNSVANATLGFGSIYVVSGPGSPRRDGLIQSANVTELEFTIPSLPDWTDRQVKDFRDDSEKSVIKNGSIKAWLSHNVILWDFLKSGKETALIMEDDVDWDIRLRTTQVPSTAAALRSILPPAEERYYWGHPDDWELLYLGHCGDYFTTVDGGQVGVGVMHPEDLFKIPHAMFMDPTLPLRTDIHPFTASLLTALDIPEKTRLIHKSKWPLCTFGYAVTRASAKRIVEELAPPKEIKGKWINAFDIAILEACRDKGLRCYSVNPELFHHMEGISIIDGKPLNKNFKPPADRVGMDQVKYRNETSNIGCGFWSQDFRWNGDVQRLAYLREEVTKNGRCLKPGRDEDGSKIRVDPSTVRRRNAV